MKVAVSSTGDSIDSPIDPRFGRCNLFLIVDTDKMSVESIENSSVFSAHGAGIGAAQKVASLGVKAVITGNVGPNAQMALSGAGVEVYMVPPVSVREAIELYKKGELTKVSSPTVGGHFGQGGGMGRGRRPW